MAEAVAVALDFEVAEADRYLIPMAVEGLAEAAGRLGEEGEVQIREELPHGAPTLGEDACPDGVGASGELTQKRISARISSGSVLRRSTPVAVSDGGFARFRGGDLAGAAGVHGPEQERWGRFGSARAGNGGLASQSRSRWANRTSQFTHGSSSCQTTDGV